MDYLQVRAVPAFKLINYAKFCYFFFFPFNNISTMIYFCFDVEVVGFYS